jgi:hypothetical protein
VAAVKLMDPGELPLWIVPLAVGVPAFVGGFLLPSRRRRIAWVLLASAYLFVAILAAVLFVLYLIAEASCPPDAYECPF